MDQVFIKHRRSKGGQSWNNVIMPMPTSLGGYRGYNDPVFEAVAVMPNYYQGGLAFNADAKDGVELVTNGDCEAALPTMNGVSLTTNKTTVSLSTDESVSGSKSVKMLGNTTGTFMNLRYAGGAACGLTSGRMYKNSVKVFIPSGQGITSVNLFYHTNDSTAIKLDSTESIFDTWITLQGDFLDDDGAFINLVSVSAPDVDGAYIYVDDICTHSTALNKIEALSNRVTNKVELLKFVNGTATTLINEAVTYSATAKLIAIHDRATNLVWLFYDGSQVGTAQTITDASVIDNTYHASFGDSVDFTGYSVRPLEFGANVSLNSNFANWTADDPDDFTVTFENVNNYIAEAVGGNAAHFVSDNTTSVRIEQASAVVSSSIQRFSLDVQNYSVGDVRLKARDETNSVDITPATNLGWNSNGGKVFYFIIPATCVSASVLIFRDTAGNTDYEFTNWEQKEVK